MLLLFDQETGYSDIEHKLRLLLLCVYVSAVGKETNWFAF